MQIYLTEEQRARLDEVQHREGKSRAELIREAVEQFLARRGPDPQAALNETFGAAKDLSVPSRDDWDRDA